MRTALLLSSIVALVALAATPTTTAAANPCDKYPNVCDIVSTECNGGNVCVVVWNGPEGTCAGVGFGLQGVGACGNARTGCATVILGFNRESVCATFVLS